MHSAYQSGHTSFLPDRPSSISFHHPAHVTAAVELSRACRRDGGVGVCRCRGDLPRLRRRRGSSVCANHLQRLRPAVSTHWVRQVPSFIARCWRSRWQAHSDKQTAEGRDGQAACRRPASRSPADRRRSLPRPLQVRRQVRCQPHPSHHHQHQITSQALGEAGRALRCAAGVGGQCSFGRTNPIPQAPLRCPACSKPLRRSLGRRL